MTIRESVIDLCATQYSDEWFNLQKEACEVDTLYRYAESAMYGLEHNIDGYFIEDTDEQINAIKQDANDKKITLWRRILNFILAKVHTFVSMVKKVLNLTEKTGRQSMTIRTLLRTKQFDSASWKALTDAIKQVKEQMPDSPIFDADINAPQHEKIIPPMNVSDSRFASVSDEELDTTAWLVGLATVQGSVNIRVPSLYSTDQEYPFAPVDVADIIRIVDAALKPDMQPDKVKRDMQESITRSSSNGITVDVSIKYAYTLKDKFAKLEQEVISAIKTAAQVEQPAEDLMKILNQILMCLSRTSCLYMQYLNFRAMMLNKIYPVIADGSNIVTGTIKNVSGIINDKTIENRFIGACKNDDVDQARTLLIAYLKTNEPLAPTIDMWLDYADKYLEQEFFEDTTKKQPTFYALISKDHCSLEDIHAIADSLSESFQKDRVEFAKQACRWLWDNHKKVGRDKIAAEKQAQEEEAKRKREEEIRKYQEEHKEEIEESRRKLEEALKRNKAEAEANRQKQFDTSVSNIRAFMDGENNKVSSYYVKQGLRDAKIKEQFSEDELKKLEKRITEVEQLEKEGKVNRSKGFKVLEDKKPKTDESPKADNTPRTKDMPTQSTMKPVPPKGDKHTPPKPQPPTSEHRPSNNNQHPSNPQSKPNAKPSAKKRHSINVGGIRITI